MGVTSYFGAQVNGWEGTVGLDPDIMINISMEWSDKGDGVSFKVRDMWERAEEILFNEFFLWDPKFLTAVIDNSVLMGVSVDSEGTGRGVEKVGEEVCYRYL